MSGSVLVVGIGNPDRGDDAVGRLVARAFGPAAPPGVRVLEHTGDAADLVEELGGADAAILVDAALSGGAPGTIRRIDAAAEALPAEWFDCSTHGLGLAAAVELARALGRLPRRCVVFAVEAAGFEAGTPPSADAAAAVGPVVEAIGREIAETRAEPPDA